MDVNQKSDFKIGDIVRFKYSMDPEIFDESNCDKFIDDYKRHTNITTIDHRTHDVIGVISKFYTSVHELPCVKIVHLEKSSLFVISCISDIELFDNVQYKLICS